MEKKNTEVFCETKQPIYGQKLSRKLELGDIMVRK